MAMNIIVTAAARNDPVSGNRELENAALHPSKLHVARQPLSVSI